MRVTGGDSSVGFILALKPSLFCSMRNGVTAYKRQQEEAADMFLGSCCVSVGRPGGAICSPAKEDLFMLAGSYPLVQFLKG